LHAGSLVVILLFFRTNIANILRALLKRDFASETGKLALYIAIGTVPVALAGYILHDTVELLFNNALAVGIALLFTGLLLFFSGRREEGHRDLGFVSSVLTGMAQARCSGSGHFTERCHHKHRPAVQSGKGEGIQNGSFLVPFRFLLG